MSTSRDYIQPSGEVLKEIIFNDIQEKNGDGTPKTYSAHIERKRLVLEECADDDDRGILFVKFVDMEDKGDMILFSLNGKLRMEKI